MQLQNNLHNLSFSLAIAFTDRLSISFVTPKFLTGNVKPVATRLSLGNTPLL
jgi:hypothetical protein